MTQNQEDYCWGCPDYDKCTDTAKVCEPEWLYGELEPPNQDSHVMDYRVEIGEIPF